MVFAQISRIDLAIRSKWTDEYRENMPPGVTFTRCMMKHKASAEQLWSTDLSRDMQPFPKHEKGEGKGAKPDRFAKQTAAAARQTKGAGKQKKGAAKGTAKGVSKTEDSVKLGQPAFVANKKLRQHRVTVQSLTAPSSTRTAAQRQNVLSYINVTC